MRAIFEVTLWVAVLTLVTTLSGCDEQDNQPGAKQECAMTSQGEICRTPDGLKQN